MLFYTYVFYILHFILIFCLLKDIKRSTDLMFMLGLKETIDRLAMANSVHWYGHVLRREDGHVLRRALDFEVEGQRKAKEYMEKAG